MITAEALKQFVEENPKLVTRKELSIPGLYILKYKRNVFWDNLWNEFLLESRGTVVDENYKVVSRPFTKIFNHFENGTTIPRDERVVAYKKINGFMASITFYKGHMLVTTTGTDDSEFAELARNMIVQHCDLEKLEWWLTQSKEIPMTAIVEICHSSDPHIVPEREGVYLLGFRYNTWDSVQNILVAWSPEMYYELAETLGMFYCEAYQTRFSDIVELSKKVTHEGFVVYGAGVNLKIKSPYYLMAKFLARKNEDKLIRLIDNPDEIKKIVDEEYYGVVDFICKNKDVFVASTEQERLNIIHNYFQGDSGNV